MRFTSKLLLSFVLMVAVCPAIAQVDQIDPTSQIQWNLGVVNTLPNCTQNGQYATFPYGAQWGQHAIVSSTNVEWTCTPTGWLNESGGGLPAGCTSSGAGNLSCTGTGTFGTVAAAATVVGDIERNGTNWYDVRSKGAVCNGILTSGVWSGTDDTAAFAAIGASNPNKQSIQIPPFPNNYCSIQPGPSSGAAAFTINTNGFILAGAVNTASQFVDETNTSTPVSNAPILQIGTGASLLNGTTLRDFGLLGAKNVSYPYGMLEMFANNITTMARIAIQVPAGATNSYGLYVNTSGAAGGLFGEVKFYDWSFYNTGAGSEPVPGANNTAAFISADSNVDFVNPNVENFNTGIVFQSGPDHGTPNLSWIGGHFERDNVAFIIQQAQFHLSGVCPTGAIYLDSSVFGSDINICAAASGYNSPIIDNGVGNQIHEPTMAGSYQAALNFDGSEQYTTLTLTADPLFLVSPTGGWTTFGSGSSIVSYNETSPGAKAGSGITITSTPGGSGGQVTTQTLPQSSEVVLVLVLRFSKNEPAVTVNVLDNANSGATIYTATVAPTIGLPVTGDGNGNGVAYKTLRVALPTAANATTFTIQIAPTAAAGVINVDYYGVNPSSVTQDAGVATSGASCTTAGVYTDTCTIPGRSGGPYAGVVWTPSTPTYRTGAYARLTVSTTANAVAPECKFGTYVVFFPINTTWEVNLPIPFWPDTITCYDASASYLYTSMTVSQVSVVPIYNQTVISGMTAGQVPIATTVSTVTSSKALAGTGTGIATGPTSTTLNDCVKFSDTAGTLADAGAACGGSGTKCAAKGSAASPSLVTCGAALAGLFSCATNASAATCVISTTAVTANSVIEIESDSSLGPALSVTCNTTADSALTAPRVSARSAGTSFTIALGTFTTNPECFSYLVIN